MEDQLRIAILGGGPGGLFMFKRLVESGSTSISITVFERKNQLGSGMPYSAAGANDEHVTNVSGNEIPAIVIPLSDWIKTVPKDTLDKFHIDPARFNDYKVLPRLLFGQYLTAQFAALQKQAKDKGIAFEILYNSTVTDIIDHPDNGRVVIEVDQHKSFEFDKVIICTGHYWPTRYEGKVQNYFDSPYPPQKLALKLNHPVAIKGSSLTAIDAIRTLSRHNGTYDKNEAGKLYYTLAEGSSNFKLVLHTRHGMLPAVRFHLEDSHLSNDSLLTKEEIAAHRAANGGFLSLDFIFEKDFKDPIREKVPEFYERIKDMNLEAFVAAMMALREELDPFQLLKAEYAEADKSIRRRTSVYWKEMLGVLSFALNYPAKHLSAEDMIRLQQTLSPLISIVIAYMPQSSTEELLALYDAGVLSLIGMGADSRVEPDDTSGAVYEYTDDTGKARSIPYNTFVDASGQPHMTYDDFPFQSLLNSRTVSPASLKFRSAEAGETALRDGKPVKKDQHGDYYLRVPGIAINDHFQVIDSYGALNDRIYMMAVPFMGGFNPDYSGLDFCEAASELIVEAIFPEFAAS